MISGSLGSVDWQLTDPLSKVDSVQRRSEEMARAKINLPVVGYGLKEKWDSLGVEWLHPVQDDSVVVPAYLPKGWRSDFIDSRDFNERGNYIFDANGKPQALVQTVKERNGVSVNAHFFFPAEADEVLCRIQELWRYGP